MQKLISILGSTGSVGISTIKIIEKKKNGNYIILSEPSEFMKKIYNVPNWIEDTSNLINLVCIHQVVYSF